MPSLEELRKKLREGLALPIEEPRLPVAEIEAGSLEEYWWFHNFHPDIGVFNYEFVPMRAPPTTHTSVIDARSMNATSLADLIIKTLTNMDLWDEERDACRHGTEIWKAVRQMAIEAKAHWEENRA